MKKILITGATNGIGLETAKLLAEQGHSLLLHGRNAEKLQRTVDSIQSSNPNIVLESYLADLSNFGDIESLTDNVLAKHKSLDVIINNAGVLKMPSPITAEGLDARFVVNTFAPAIITQRLLPILANDGRIVNLSSAAQAPVNINALLGSTSLSDDMQAYAQSKLALTIWVHETAKTLQGSQVVVAVNPGSLLASKMVKEGFGVSGNDLSIGAQILFEAALSEQFAGVSGQYFDNDIGDFSPAHPFLQKQNNRTEVMDAIAQIITEFG